MFSWSYKFVINEEKQVIKLTPTLSTWMKAFAPSLVMMAGSGLYILYLNRASDTLLENYEDPVD